ncbi:MAG TPA: hypothetical protein VFL85_03460 [Candidatus Saccharimonadales bacterium]|nr:hypothetical protein [Candidatus Saccharimonadales bacterium]
MSERFLPRLEQSPERPSIEQQAARLESMQAMQSAELHSTEIAFKLYRHLQEKFKKADLLNVPFAESKPVVYCTRGIGQSFDSGFGVGVRFIDEVDTSRYPHMYGYHQVLVGDYKPESNQRSSIKVYSGAAHLQPYGMTSRDALTVFSLAYDVLQAQARGELPDLTLDATKIKDAAATQQVPGIR